MTKFNLTPVNSYLEPYKQKTRIFRENNSKSGIYLWTNIVSGESYIGSSINLSRRLKDYFNKGYLIRELKKSKSRIYKALLKYDYINYRLDILEYCTKEYIIEREQFYLDKFKPEYNILKIAGSLKGFKHTNTSIELIRKSKLGLICSESTKLKLSANYQALPLKVENLNFKEIHFFTSIRRTALFINIHHSYLAKSLKIKGFYKNNKYYVTKNV